MWGGTRGEDLDKPLKKAWTTVESTGGCPFRIVQEGAVLVSPETKIFSN